MNPPKIKFVLILITIFFTFNLSFAENLKITSPNYFNEQNLIYEPINFLPDEMLSFEICSQETNNIKTQIICSDKTIDVNLYESSLSTNNNKCHNTNFDLSQVTCDEFELKISFEEFNKEKILTRKFQKQKESKLINHVLQSNYNNLKPLELSYYLLIQSLIEGETLKTQEIYDMLKEKRDNSQKCWPKENCDPKITAQILYNLKQAGYTDSSRLIEDGAIFLNKQTIEDSSIKYPQTTFSKQTYTTQTLLINQFDSSETECEFDIDYGDTIKTYSFDDDTDFEDFFITRDSQEKINMSCEDSIDEIELKIFDELIYSGIETNEDQFDYTISQSDREEYSEMNFDLFFNHSFSPSEEIDCDVDIDGDETDYTFDENSTFNDMRIEEEIEEEFTIDCDSNIDTIVAKIYAGEVTTQTFTSEDYFEYEISSQATEDSFNTNTFIEYEFENSNEELECTLTYDSKSKKFTFDRNDLENNKLEIKDYQIENSLSISCNKIAKEITFEVFDKFNKKQIKQITSNKISASLSIPSDFSKYSCIGDNKECDFQTSLNTILLEPENLDEKTRIEKFLDSFKQEDSEENYKIESGNNYENSGKYLLYKEDQEIVDFLKIKQNNDGSWGEETSNSDKILSTSYSVLGLQEYQKDSEYVEDGKKWIYFNEPQNGWNDIEKNSIAYLAIKEQIKPRLTITQINELEKVTIIQITNPTIYSLENIKLDFSKPIKEHLSYRESLGSLLGEETISFNVTINPKFSGKLTGELIITGVNNKKEIELIKIPITLKSPTPFEIKDYIIHITNEDIYTNIPIIPILENFNLECDFTNPFENKVEKVTINQNTNFVPLSNFEPKIGKHILEFNCKDEGNSFKESTEVEIELTTTTFKPSINSLPLSNTDDFSISIQNTFNDKQTISIEITGDFRDILIPAEKSKIFALNESRDIYFSILDEEKFNSLTQDSKGSLVLSGTNFTKEIPISVSQTPIEEETGLPWVWIILAIITISFTTLVIIRYRQLNSEELHENQEVDEHDQEVILEDMEFHK